MIVNIPDKNLEKALKKALAIYDRPLTQSDLESITGTLDISGADSNVTVEDIKDLTGIEYCINVTTLRANYQAFKNIDPISGMTSLQKFYAFWGILENLDGLKDLPSLYYINVRNNNINDIDGLKNKTNITTLYIDNNKLEDISALSNTTKFDLLNIEKNLITDLRPLNNINITNFYGENQNYLKDFGSANHKIPPSITVYEMDGTKTNIDLGTPVLGISDYNGSWDFPTSKFTGVVTLKSYGYTSTLTVDLNRPLFDIENSAAVEEEDVKTDEELKTLFDVKNISDNKDALTIDDIVVDQTNVDYDNAGVYKVMFTLKDSDTNETIHNGLLTVEFVPDTTPPVIEGIDKARVEQFTNLNDDDLKRLFQVEAYDNEDGDITHKIKMDSSGVDFNTSGFYDVYFTVEDEAGNITTKICTLDIYGKIGKIGSIKNINLIDIETFEKQNLKCGDFSANANTINFSHTTSNKKVKTKNFIFAKNDDILLDNTISFDTYFRDSIEALDFKKFFRKHDAKFILEVEKNNTIYYCYVSKSSENLSNYTDAVPLESMKISFNQLSLWLTKKEITFEIDTTITEDVNGYAAKPDSTDNKEYHYPIYYKGTPDTLDNFQVELPEFGGDFGVYLTVVLDEVEKEAAYGFNGRWNQKETQFSYRATDSFTVPKDESLVISSYPAEQGIWQQKSNNIIKFGTNREGDMVDIINGNQILDPFVEVEPNKNGNYFIFTNVKKGRIYALEQHANI